MRTVSIWVLLLVCALLTQARVRVWRSDVSLWQDGVVHAPCAMRPHLQLAKAYATAGNVHGMQQEWARVQALGRHERCD